MILAMEPAMFVKMVMDGGPVVACVAMALTVVWTLRKRVKGEVKSQINQINRDHKQELQTLKAHTAGLTRIEETLDVMAKRVTHHLGTVDNTSVRKAAIRGTVHGGNIQKIVEALEKDYDGGWLGQCIAALDNEGAISRAADDILKRLPALETVVEEMDKFMRDRFDLILDNQSTSFSVMTQQFAASKEAHFSSHRLLAERLFAVKNDTDCTVGMLKLEQRLVSPYDMQAALYAADMRQKLDDFFETCPNQEMHTNVDLDGAWAEIVIRKDGFHVDVHIDVDKFTGEMTGPSVQDTHLVDVPQAPQELSGAAPTNEGLMSALEREGIITGETKITLKDKDAGIAPFHERHPSRPSLAPPGSLSYVDDPVSTDPKDTAHFMLTPAQVAANEAAPTCTTDLAQAVLESFKTEIKTKDNMASGIAPLHEHLQVASVSLPDETAEMSTPVFSDDELLIPETELEETELDLDYPDDGIRPEMIECPRLSDPLKWKTDFGGRVEGAVLGTPAEVHESVGFVTPEVAQHIADGFDPELWNTATDETKEAALVDAAKALDESGISFIGDYDEAAAEVRTALHEGAPVDPAENGPTKSKPDGTKRDRNKVGHVHFNCDVLGGNTDLPVGDTAPTRAQTLRDILDAEEAKPVESCNLQAFCKKMREKVAAQQQVVYDLACKDLENAPTVQAATNALTTIIRLLKGN